MDSFSVWKKRELSSLLKINHMLDNTGQGEFKEAERSKKESQVTQADRQPSCVVLLARRLLTSCGCISLPTLPSFTTAVTNGGREDQV
jgi:hypothetical protein